jgi:hydrogenase maturation protease
MTGRTVVIGIGNEYRRDDGVGPRVVDALAASDVSGVRLVVSDGEPAGLLADWAGVALAIVVDAVLCEPADPGRVHRTSLAELNPPAGATSSHGLGIPEAVALGRVLDRMPEQLVVYAVEASDVDLGVELTDPVAAALPRVVAAVRAELVAAGLAADGHPVG